MMRLAHHLRDFEPGWISSVCKKQERCKRHFGLALGVQGVKTLKDGCLDFTTERFLISSTEASILVQSLYIGSTGEPQCDLQWASLTDLAILALTCLQPY